MTFSIESRPSELDIVGTDQEGIRISCTLRDSGRSDDVRIWFDKTGDFARLRVRGGPSDNVQIRVEVPRRSNLKLRMGAGEVKVDEVSGNKDIALSAGEVRVSGVNDSEYHSVNASVDIGAVNSQSFGVGKGGFFRSFDRDSLHGQYRLHVHLMTGNIQLN